MMNNPKLKFNSLLYIFIIIFFISVIVLLVDIPIVKSTYNSIINVNEMIDKDSMIIEMFSKLSVNEEWKEYFSDIIHRKCKFCHSKRVMTISRGKPISKWQEFHEFASSQLGWETHKFYGCTTDLNDRNNICLTCQQVNILQ